jgi:hypothetical protein
VGSNRRGRKYRRKKDATRDEDQPQFVTPPFGGGTLANGQSGGEVERQPVPLAEALEVAPVEHGHEHAARSQR